MSSSGFSIRVLLASENMTHTHTHTLWHKIYLPYRVVKSMNFYLRMHFLEMQSAKPSKTWRKLCNSFRVPVIATLNREYIMT